MAKLEALLYVVAIELQKIKNEENCGRIKGTLHVRIENFMLTPDSQTPDSTDREMSSREGTPSEDGWVTPKRRYVEGVDLIKCRRINFDLAEDDEEIIDEEDNNRSD